MHPAVRTLYKELLHAAREYPGGMEAARRKLKGAFLRNASVDVKNLGVLEESLKKGEHVLRELDALRRLHKYRYGAKDYFVSRLLFVSSNSQDDFSLRRAVRSSGRWRCSRSRTLLWPLADFSVFIC